MDLSASQVRVVKPRRRVCPGQSVRFPITAHNAFDWLRGGDEARMAFEVDGFVTTPKGGVSGVFQKFELLRHEAEGGALLLSFREEIAACAGFAERLASVHRVFVWPEGFPNTREEKEALITSIAPRVVGGLLDLGRRKQIGLPQLAAGIRKLRGRAYTSVKPMLSATSGVECYLANQTSDPWPGDIDAVLSKRESGAVEALVEFKTHNRNTPLEEEHIGKYGQADWRRFRVLYQLRDRLLEQQGYAPRLYYVAWGTQDYEHHRRVKVDELGRDEVLRTVLLERPAWGARSEELLSVLGASSRSPDR